MSSPSTSYFDTESSTSSHSSSDESVERGEPSKHPECGEPSKHPECREPSKHSGAPKCPELKVIIREALRNPWAPQGNIPVARVVLGTIEPLLICHVPNHKIRSTTLAASNARDKIESYESPVYTYISEVYTRAQKAVKLYTYI